MNDLFAGKLTHVPGIVVDKVREEQAQEKPTLEGFGAWLRKNKIIPANKEEPTLHKEVADEIQNFRLNC